ncbi:MAG: hypothetical protein WC796_06380 [Candidatus Pacearchaeota archaeon]|jgi:hypothetical protein
MKDCNQNPICNNCSEHFQLLRPSIKEVILSSHFKKDLPNFNTDLILDCQHEHFTRLHKFEEKIGNSYLFRALSDKTHIVYAIQEEKIIFLRAFGNFKEYSKFLSEKKAITNLLNQFLV